MKVFGRKASREETTPAHCLFFLFVAQREASRPKELDLARSVQWRHLHFKISWLRVGSELSTPLKENYVKRDRNFTKKKLVFR